MKKSVKILIIIIMIAIFAGLGVGAYFIFRNNFAGSNSSVEGDANRDDDENVGKNPGITSSAYDGMYYYYIAGTFYKSVYVKIKGNKWENSDNENGTYKVSGTNITFYRTIMGDNEIVLTGTIYDGVITIEQNVGGISMNVYYCKEGSMPS